MKTTLTVTVDVDVINEIRKKGVNISKVVNDFLRSYSGSKELKLNKSVFDTRDKILLLKTQVTELERHEEELKKKNVIFTDEDDRDSLIQIK